MSSEPVNVSGHCYCGGITYDVHIPSGAKPIFAAYCHCDSCRRSHAAPLYHVAVVEESMFTLTSGEPLLNAFQKPGGTITRAFCSGCGTRILNRFGSWTPGGRVPLAFFPNTLDEQSQAELPDCLRAQRNNAADSCVLDPAMLRGLLSGG